jgi:hypothetical protein
VYKIISEIGVVEAGFESSKVGHEVEPSAELASTSPDGTDAKGAVKYAQVGHRTKLDEHAVEIREALDRDGRRPALALVDELRAVLLALTIDDVEQPTLWQRLMMDDDDP